MHLDGIVVTGKEYAMHVNNREMLVKRFQENVLMLRNEKCKCMTSSVELFGHVINEHGLNEI